MIKIHIDYSGLGEKSATNKRQINAELYPRKYTRVIFMDSKKAYDRCFSDDTWRCLSEIIAPEKALYVGRLGDRVYIRYPIWLID